MADARVFVPQEAVESWISEGRAELLGDVLALDGERFTVTGAVRILAEVAGGGDLRELVGRVKTTQQLEALHADHVGASLTLGDDAYEVIEGYTLSPVAPSAIDPYPQLVRLFTRP